MYFHWTVDSRIFVRHSDGNSEIETNITLGGLVQYTFTGVTIPVVPSVGLPGLSYPGLLTIGPYYEINFGLTGDIALDG